MKKFLEDNTHHVSIIFYIIIFVVFFAVGAFLLSQNTKKQTDVTSPGYPQNNEQKIEDGDGQWMKVVLVNGERPYAVGEEIEVQIVADSDGEDINGYDALFFYDPSLMTVSKVSSLLPSFTVYPHNNANFVSITAAKSLTQSDEVEFDGTPVLTITLKAVSPGSASVYIAPESGREKTKMVNDKAEILMPMLEPAKSVTIQ